MPTGRWHYVRPEVSVGPSAISFCEFSLYVYNCHTPVKTEEYIQCLSPLFVQDYLLAVEVYEGLLEELPGLRSQLLSVMGRLHLTLGDLPSAQTLFSLAEDRDEKEEGEEERMVRTHINQ